MLSAIDRRPHVVGFGQADAHSVNIVSLDQFSIVSEGLAMELLALGMKSLMIDIAYANESAALERRIDLGMLAPNEPGAYDAHAYLLHRQTSPQVGLQHSHACYGLHDSLCAVNCLIVLLHRYTTA